VGGIAREKNDWMNMVPNGETTAKNSADLTRDDGFKWRLYVEGTRSNYINHYVSFARQNTNTYLRLGKELENMMTAAQQAGIQRAYSTVLEMTEWLWSGGGQFLDLRGHFQEGQQLLTQAVNAARLLGDRSQEERLFGQLGRAWMALRDWPAAAKYFEQALILAKEIGDREGEASHLGHLGQLQLQQDNLLKAADCFQEAIKIAREIREPQMVGRLWASLGLFKLRNQMSVGYSQERIVEAIEDFKNAVAIARETGDHRGEASHLGCIGRAYELMASMKLSLPPFVGGSPYPGEDAARYERYQKQLEQADQESYLTSYEYYSGALSIAGEVGDEQMQERLHGDRARVGHEANLPFVGGTEDIDVNIWMRNQRPPYTGHVPGRRQ